MAPNLTPADRLDPERMLGAIRAYGDARAAGDVKAVERLAAIIGELREWTSFPAATPATLGPVFAECAAPEAVEVHLVKAKRAHQRWARRVQWLAGLLDQKQAAV